MYMLVVVLLGHERKNTTIMCYVYCCSLRNAIVNPYDLRNKAFQITTLQDFVAVDLN